MTNKTTIRKNKSHATKTTKTKVARQPSPYRQAIQAAADGKTETFRSPRTTS